MGYLYVVLNTQKMSHIISQSNLGNKAHYAHELNTLYRVGVKKYGFTAQLDTMYQVGMPCWGQVR